MHSCSVLQPPAVKEARDPKVLVSSLVAMEMSEKAWPRLSTVAMKERKAYGDKSVSTAHSEETMKPNDDEQPKVRTIPHPPCVNRSNRGRKFPWWRGSWQCSTGRRARTAPLLVEPMARSP